MLGIKLLELWYLGTFAMLRLLCHLCRSNNVLNKNPGKVLKKDVGFNVKPKARVNDKSITSR